MPCEVVPLRVDFFKMVAVAMETAKMLKNWTEQKLMKLDRNNIHSLWNEISQKNFHTLRWIFLRYFMKFDERNPIFFKSLLFLAYLVPLDVDVTGNITAKIWSEIGWGDVRYCFGMAILVIKSPKQRLETYCFCSVSYYYYYSSCSCVRNFKFPIGFYSNPHLLWTPKNMALTPFTTKLKTLGSTRNIYL
jgi:hypothetical protein